MKKIIFITTLFSPFQIELNKCINRKGEIKFYHVFTKTSYKGRGTHWNSIDSKSDNVITINATSKVDKIKSLFKIIKEVNPDLIIIGQIRGIVPTISRFYAWTNNVPFVFWLEQPFPKNTIISKFLKYIDCYVNFFGTRNIIGIGERATKYYANFAPTFLIPYSQDLLSINSKKPNRSKNERLKFLFSGQLIVRHNIDIILESIKLLYIKVGSNFNFIFAAKGELMADVHNFLLANPQLKEIVSFDNEYSKWDDRLRPFYYSDVLVYPSKHSGWGLVVPEALASELFVISTSNVESVRYFINNNVNGLIINESAQELYKAMKKCIVDKDFIYSKKENILTSFIKGDVTYVAPILTKHILKTLKK